jgi:hypothetical protein
VYDHGDERQRGGDVPDHLLGTDLDGLRHHLRSRDFDHYGRAPATPAAPTPTSRSAATAATSRSAVATLIAKTGDNVSLYYRKGALPSAPFFPAQYRAEMHLTQAERRSGLAHL